MNLKKALEFLKISCMEHEDCITCALYDEMQGCMLMWCSPEEYYIEEDPEEDRKYLN